ncbi:MAG: Signal recognition particle receptor protein FtsY, partial [Myxococcaceae bacterium]|nr:Signal recognition particle receptor protein FtsY [Myxococcaceae bacterium]
MKFLCEQCKAKYQISDEKVAGKTVRMKCRKCGHMIEVRAEVTESSVAKPLPTGEVSVARANEALRAGSAGTSAGAPRPA